MGLGVHHVDRDPLIRSQTRAAPSHPPLADLAPSVCATEYCPPEIIRLKTPFPSQEIRPRAVGTVRTPSGRREAQRGRTDPFQASPGPSES